MLKPTLLSILLLYSFSMQTQFQRQVILETGSENQDISIELVADLTNDSIPEIIGRSSSLGTVYTLSRQADGSYQQGKPLAANSEAWSFLKAGDINGDNFNDLIIYKDDGQVLWMQNDQQGSFLAIQTLFQDDQAKFLQADDLMALDIDNDGRDDIAARLPGKIIWYQSQGNAVAAHQTLLDVKEDKADAFEDGQLAISVINPAGYRVLALLANGAVRTANNASGTFVWDQTLSSDTLRAGYIQWADMDQDGYQDLVVSDIYSWTGIYHLWYYAHDPDGKLTPNIQTLGAAFLGSQAMQYIGSVFPSDIDGDGDTDTFVQIQPEGCDPESQTSTLGWLENQQDWSATTFHAIASEKAVAFADLDNDKDTDVVVTTANEIILYQNPLQKGQLPIQDIALSDGTIVENMPIGTLVAEIISQNPDTLLTFQLVAGEGSGGNASFEVKGRQLLTTASLDYKVQNEYTIRLQATDTSGTSFQKTFIIRVVEVQEDNAPIVVKEIPAQTTSVGQYFELTIPEDAFADASNSLTYTVSLIKSDTLPSWLAFDTQTKTLSGTPSQADSLNISVTASDINGASASQNFSLVIKDNITGINLPDASIALVIYPNPITHQQLFLRFDALSAKTIMYYLWNIEGKVIQKGQAVYHHDTAMISLQDIRPGVYVVEIQSGSNVARKRIIVR